MLLAVLLAVLSLPSPTRFLSDNISISNVYTKARNCIGVENNSSCCLDNIGASRICTKTCRHATIQTVGSCSILRRRRELEGTLSEVFLLARGVFEGTSCLGILVGFRTQRRCLRLDTLRQIANIHIFE